MISQHAIRLATADDAPHIGLMSRDLIERGLRWRWTPERIRACIRSRTTNVAVAPAEHGLAVRRLELTQPEGTVTRQDPSNKRVDEGSTVTLVLAKAQEAPPTTPPPTETTTPPPGDGG